MSDAQGPVTTTVEDGVAVVRFDDGKANVLSYGAVEALDRALDRAEADADSVCLVGREGKLCAGFDLAVMTGCPNGSSTAQRARKLSSRSSTTRIGAASCCSVTVVAVSVIEPAIGA